MKKVFGIISVLVLAVVVGLAVKSFEDRQLVELDDGRIVAAETVWIVGSNVFVQTGGAIASYPQQQVLHIAEGRPNSFQEVRLRLFDLAEQLKGRWRQLDAATGGLRLAAVVLGAVVLIVPAAWVLGARRRRGRKAPGKRATVPSGSAERIAPRLAKREDLETFFLDIYRAQLGVDPRTEANIELVSAGPGPGRQYRLKVFHNGQWRERRMTVGFLGAELRSKSQCFYVIFDTHLVVKIPPVPIRDFSDYLRRLHKEARIVSRLEGRPCIIPNLTAILSRIVHFSEESDPQRLEEQYLQWLEGDPGRQRHLKIAGAFAFFMDLSRHQFLGHVLAQLNDGAGRMAEVMAEDIALIDDCQEFEAKYGPQDGRLCFELQNVYTTFATGLRQKLAAAGQADVIVTEIEKKGWLLARLAGVSKPDATPASVVALRDALLDEVVEGRQALVKEYRRMVGTEGRRRALRQNKARMAALATNMLDLLAWLGKHRVAMRDLKPDNLLVAVNAAEDLHSLSEPGRFVIGLIDVETAVVYPSGDETACDQPQLGGTPSYATPSQFFPNTLLSALYDDLGQVLHLQDWYAVIAIIFEIVAGGRLFINTGQLFPGWIGTIRKATGGPQEAEGLYRSFSRQFWEAARSEFDRRLTAAEPWLRTVKVGVPEFFQDRLADYLWRRNAELKDRMEAIVASQDAVGDPQRCRELSSMGPIAIDRLIARCQGQSGPAGKRLMATLQELAAVKKALSRNASHFQAMTRADAGLQTKILLPIMFDIVASGMQPRPCPADSRPEPAVAPDLPRQTDEATLGFTHTANL